MQFIVIAPDKPNNLEKRLAARADHIALGNKLREEGKHLFGVALIDQTDSMCGSVLIVEFEDRKALDEWLSIEPYVTGGVWDMKKVTIQECKVGPSFLQNYTK